MVINNKIKISSIADTAYTATLLALLEQLSLLQCIHTGIYTYIAIWLEEYGNMPVWAPEL